VIEKGNAASSIEPNHCLYQSRGLIIARAGWLVRLSLGAYTFACTYIYIYWRGDWQAVTITLSLSELTIGVP
jgi:hypothetical protein